MEQTFQNAIAWIEGLDFQKWVLVHVLMEGEIMEDRLSWKEPFGFHAEFGYGYSRLRDCSDN